MPNASRCFSRLWASGPSNGSTARAKSARFELSAIKAGEMQLGLTVHGGLDFIDLDYDIKNIGHKVISRATETCFQSLNQSGLGHSV